MQPHQTFLGKQLGKCVLVIVSFYFAKHDLMRRCYGYAYLTHGHICGRGNIVYAD